MGGLTYLCSYCLFPRDHEAAPPERHEKGGAVECRPPPADQGVESQHYTTSHAVCAPADLLEQLFLIRPRKEDGSADLGLWQQQLLCRKSKLQELGRTELSTPRRLLPAAALRHTGAC